MVVRLLESGLPKLQTSFGIGRIPHAHFLNRLRIMLIDICCRYGETMLKEKKFPLVSYREPTERSGWMQLYYTDNLLHVLKGNNGLSC
ncbi:unnamed protein product, partial [Vitis vinifera]|uniref:Uncharacterized protein n=1 Tax=Vitis vinifera TaxID=29760 RepID=D7TYI0_VITVI